MNLSRGEREDAIRKGAKPLPASIRIVEAVWKPPTLMGTSLLAADVKSWKRISKPNDHIYLGSTDDGVSIAVSILTAPSPKYITYVSHESQPGLQTFITPTDSSEAEMPERIINIAVLKILRGLTPKEAEE